MQSLNIFLVGGAVRDKYLGLPVQDHDWVVTGSRTEDMLALGFKRVGTDFPVFLHPETSEEYALARTERKSGKGYLGFECNAAPEVTLEEDLLRRDFTINAMAEDNAGNLIDPYGGLQDLKAGVLRHVSPAFSEDPLRVLRLARFTSRFAAMGFSVAPETLDLCKAIKAAGELSHLTPERVWQETRRSLGETQPRVFFETLRSVDALEVLFPEISALFGVPQPEQYHPEIDCGLHALMSLEQACSLSNSIDVRFAALIHDLGKATTPESEWPRHFGHEIQGLKPIKALCHRLKTPKSTQALALLSCEFHTHIHRAAELNPKTVLKVLKRCDAFRKPERFREILLVSEADARGRTGLETADYPQRRRFEAYLDAALSTDIKALLGQGLKGPALGEAIDEARIEAVSALKKAWDKHDQ